MNICCAIFNQTCVLGVRDCFLKFPSVDAQLKKKIGYIKLWHQHQAVTTQALDGQFWKSFHQVPAANVEAVPVSMATATACHMFLRCCDGVLFRKKPPAHKPCPVHWKQTGCRDTHIDDSLISLLFSWMGMARGCQHLSIVRQTLFIGWILCMLFSRLGPLFTSHKLSAETCIIVNWTCVLAYSSMIRTNILHFKGQVLGQVL